MKIGIWGETVFLKRLIDFFLIVFSELIGLSSQSRTEIESKSTKHKRLERQGDRRGNRKRREVVGWGGPSADGMLVWGIRAKQCLYIGFSGRWNRLHEQRWRALSRV